MQREGGSIGASITVQPSRVVMRKWDGLFMRKIEAELNKLGLDIKYVDDKLVAVLWQRSH